MQYNNEHKVCWYCALNLLKYHLGQRLHSSSLFTLNYPSLSHLSCLISKRLSKVVLILIFFLPYSVNIQALSATTTQTIQGSAPYLTFDGGKTKARDTKELTSITLSDGRTYTIDDAKATETNPIVMAKNGETFSDLKYAMNFDSEAIFLTNITNPAYHYWGDDDGDGDATINTFGNAGDITSGRLSRVILDRWGGWFGRKTELSWCKGAPYTMELITDSGILSTKYGSPNVSSFTKATAKYHFVPNSPPLVCYVTPFKAYVNSGPEDQWDNKKESFIKVSTTSYASNFPTTGFNGAYFDLDMGGTGEVTFPPVTHEGITASVTKLPFDNSYQATNGLKVRVTLTGPFATKAEIAAATATTIKKPKLPVQFELIGYDKNGKKIIKYGFVLKQWLIGRGVISDYESAQKWCQSAGYRLPRVKDLTNGVCAGNDVRPNTRCNGMVGGKPSSSDNNPMRAIGAGILAEWGDIYLEGTNNLTNIAVMFTSDITPDGEHFAVSLSGSAGTYQKSLAPAQGVCVTP